MSTKEFYKRNKSVVHEGVVYTLGEDDFSTFTSDWIMRDDPSTWACSETVSYVRGKWPELPRSKVMELTAEVLGKTVQEVEHMLEWNAQYMAWHEGTDPADNHVYPPDEP